MSQTRSHNALYALLNEYTTNNKYISAREPSIEQLEKVYAGPEDLKFSQHNGPSDFSEDFFTPIHLATFCGFQNVVKWLLSKGDDINRQTLMGRTPLFISLYQMIRDKMNSSLAEFIIENNADVNLHENEQIKAYRRSPLMLVVCEERYVPNLNSKMIKLLLEKNADIYHRDSHGLTCIQYSKGRGAPALIKILEEEKSNRERIFDIVRNAEKQKSLEPSIQSLEDAYLLRANVSYYNKYKKAAIHSAASAGFNNVIEWLLNKGVSVEVEDDLKATPLLYAAQCGQLETCKLLVNKFNANINKQDLYGVTALINSLHKKNEKLAQWLIENNADVNLGHCKSNYGSMHYAVENGNESIVKLLISKKAKLNEVTKSGRTPLTIAKKLNHLGIIELLKQHIPSSNIENKEIIFSPDMPKIDWQAIENAISLKNVDSFKGFKSTCRLLDNFKRMYANFLTQGETYDLRNFYNSYCHAMPFSLAKEIFKFLVTVEKPACPFYEIMNQCHDIIPMEYVTIEEIRKFIITIVQSQINNITNIERAVEITNYFESSLSLNIKKLFTTESGGFIFSTTETSEWDALKSSVKTQIKDKMKSLSEMSPNYIRSNSATKSVLESKQAIASQPSSNNSHSKVEIDVCNYVPKSGLYANSLTIYPTLRKRNTKLAEEEQNSQTQSINQIPTYHS